MAGSVAVFLAVFGGAVFLAAVLRRRVSAMAPWSLLFYLAHTYLCGLLGLLRFSVLMTGGLMIALGVLGLILSLRKSHPWRAQWDTSLLLYALGFAWLLYVSSGRLPLTQAEYTQWALAPKAMLYTGSLTPADAPAALSPMLAVLQVIFQGAHAALAPGSGLQDWLFYVPGGFFCLTLLLPLAASSHPKAVVRTIYALCAYLVASLLPLLFFDAYSSLTPNAPLAVLAAAAFLLAAKSKSLPQAFAMGLYLMVLVLLKDAGLYFALAAYAVYFLTLWRDAQLRQTARTRHAMLALIPLALLFLARLSWPRLGFTLHAASEAGASLSLFWQMLTARLISLRAGLVLPTSTPFTLFTAHISVLAVLLILTVVSAWLLHAMKRWESLAGMRAALWMASATSLVYIAGLWLTYLFIIDPVDAQTLVGFAGFAGIALLCWSLTALGAELALARENTLWTWRRHLLTALGCGLALLVASGAVSGLTARGFTKDVERYHTYFAVADTAAEALPEDARVYIVSQLDDGTVYNTLRYALYPRAVNPADTGWLYDPAGKENAWAYPIAPEDWKAEVMVYDYVLLYRTDPLPAKRRCAAGGRGRRTGDWHAVPGEQGEGAAAAACRRAAVVQ